MVLTPFHYVHSYAVYRISRKRLSLPGLVIGLIVPDLETPILYFMGFPPPFNSLILHSLIGSLMFSWILGLLLLPLCGFLIERFLNVTFSHKHGLINYVVAVLISAELHLFVDAFHHPYNPLLWPITSESIDFLVLFNDWILASIVLQLFFSFFMLMIVWIELRNIDLKRERLEVLRRLFIALLVE